MASGPQALERIARQQDRSLAVTDTTWESEPGPFRGALVVDVV
ncbi:hypothetical protein [Streptomyces xantholiticus]|uniref:Uncharacterized protein n=1 Tax=Streptomyces xantholiticus TaxID=68285 RepID=A0ABV1V3B2_9ACTN